MSWLVNGKEVDGRLEEFGQNIVVSKLTVPQLRREHRNTTYKCQAANTHLIPPLEKTVILDVYREYFSPSSFYLEENFRRRTFSLFVGAIQSIFPVRQVHVA